MKRLYFLFSFLFISLVSYAQDAFITTWEVETGDLDITIPVVPAEYSYDYTIDFGDGTVVSNVASSITHTYTSAGTYSVEITGTFPAIRINDLDGDDKFKLKSVEQWGDISWQTMYRAFNDAYNLVVNATDAPDLSQVTDMSYMFVNAWNFNQSINHWDVSNIEDMSWIFDGAEIFNQPLDNWDVSSVTNMFRMFFEAFSFNQPLNNWDVSNVTSMGSMFSQETNPSPDDIGMIFNQPLDNWNVSNVTSMDRMFYRNEFFNQPLNSWDVSNVTDMDYMFSGCDAFNQSLNNWNTSSVSSMDRMFQGAISFNQNINSWDVSNVDDMSYFFAQAESFNQPLNSWDVSSVTTMAGMFWEAELFNQPLNNWDVSSVTQMFNMFEDASSFNQPLNNWDVSNVESMTQMFLNAETFNSNIDTWDLSGIVQDDFDNGIRSMFRFADSFNQPLENWNISNLTSLESLFSGAYAFNQPLDAWDVSNVTEMQRMFSDATSFNQPLDSWDVSNVTLMYQMFKGAISFNQPLDSWDVSSVTNMLRMFREATAFNQPLNSWNVSNVTNISRMFEGASSFNQPLDSWNVSSATSLEKMFSGATSFNQDISDWNVSNVFVFAGTFDGANAFHQPLNTWDFSQAITLVDFLNSTNMSIENYDALLQHLTTFNLNNLDFGAEGLEYCNSGAVDYLVNQLNWTITGHSLADCNTISGTVYLDTDNNGCDASDVKVSNYFVFFENTDNQNLYAAQINNGIYSGGIAGTNFTASVQGLPDYMIASPVDAIIEFTGGSTDETVDFCLTASQAIEDLSITLISTSEARPGFESTYQLIIENLGTESISNVVVDLTFDDTMQSFVSAMPTPDATTSDNLQFNFTAIDPFQAETVDLTMQIFTPPIVFGDDILIFDATVSPDTNDYAPDNNAYNLEQIVVNSFDPNDINVLQGETITTAQTGDYLDYVIRFQNTGTASAINVEVESLLHQNLNASTFRVLSASHGYTAAIENNIITFNFDNINLPDETTDPEGSNGFIAYRLKPKADIQIGEVMDGIAAIYFDFNEPIVTNMVSTEVINPLGVDEYQLNKLLTIYPNPTDKGFHLISKDGIAIKSIQLYDLKGSQLLSIEGLVDYIDTKHIDSGVYSLIVNTESGRLIKKLVIN